MNLLKRILTAVVLIPIVLLLVLRAPIPVVAVVAAVVAVLAVQELLKLAEAYGIRPFHGATYIFVALLFVLLAVNPGDKPLSSTAFFAGTVVLAAAVAPFAFLVLGMRREDLSGAFPAAMASATWPCLWDFWCSCASNGRGHFLCSICCCWSGREIFSRILWGARSDGI